MLRNFFIALFCHLLAGCAAQKTTTDKPYYEDLSALRPKVIVPTDTPRKDTSASGQTKVVAQVTPTHQVNQKIDIVLDSIDRYNQVRKFVDGYTIQIYSGQNREDAMETKRKMTADLPDYIANLQYQQPKFRVTVGRYYSKLEAHPDLIKLRRNFSAAILVPEKIPVR